MAEQYANETAEEFSSRLFNTIRGGFTGLAISLGLKSGLFDILLAHHDKPLTSQELADAADMKERYVREWLGAMTTAHIVDLDQMSSPVKYQIPAHRLDSFRPETLAGQVADLSHIIPVYSGTINHMLEVLKKDGPRGHEPSTIENFIHEVEKYFGRPWYSHCFVQEFIPSYPEIQAKLESGIQMLDVGCGEGVGTLKLAQKFPESQFVGLDIIQANVDLATAEAINLGMKNVKYVCADAIAMPQAWTSIFDYVFFFNVLHDVPRPDLVMDEVKRVMKKDGIMSVLELDFESTIAKNIGKAQPPLFYVMSLFYCLPASMRFVNSFGLGAIWGKDNIVDFLEGKGFNLKSISKVPKCHEIHFLCQRA